MHSWGVVECGNLPNGRKGGYTNMDNKKLQPLSEIEKRMSEENHGLVYSFLHRHGYSIEEFYNIVIWGYIKGIQIYNRRDDLKEKYQLSFICEQYMRAELSNHFKKENAKKRKPVGIVLSLDADYAEEENLHNCTGGKSAEDEVIAKETLIEILDILTDIQRKIFVMIAKGYSIQETISSLNMKKSTYYKELRKIKSIMENVRC